MRSMNIAVQGFEQSQWLFIQINAALLVSIDDVKSILPPICLDVILAKCRWKHLVTWIL